RECRPPLGTPTRRLRRTFPSPRARWSLRLPPRLPTDRTPRARHPSSCDAFAEAYPAPAHGPHFRSRWPDLPPCLGFRWPWPATEWPEPRAPERSASTPATRRPGVAVHRRPAWRWLRRTAHVPSGARVAGCRRPCTGGRRGPGNTRARIRLPPRHDRAQSAGEQRQLPTAARLRLPHRRAPRAPAYPRQARRSAWLDGGEPALRRPQARRVPAWLPPAARGLQAIPESPMPGRGSVADSCPVLAGQIVQRLEQAALQYTHLLFGDIQSLLADTSQFHPALIGQQGIVQREPAVFHFDDQGLEFGKR